VFAASRSSAVPLYLFHKAAKEGFVERCIVGKTRHGWRARPRYPTPGGF